MKIKIRRLLIGLSVVMLAMALLALAMMSMRDEMQTQTLLRAYALTTRLAFEEGMLKESLLRTRFGVDTNYDALASNLNAIESGGRELVDLRLPQPVGGMVSQLARTQRVERKQALEFETLNAVLHNSLDYFLYRMQQVLPELPDSGPNRDLQHALGGLVIEIVQRTLSPHPQATDAQASRRAEQLLERAAEALPQDGNVIRLMARHVALIDANAPLRAATMESIVNSSSRPQLLHIGSVIDREIARRDLVHGRERIAALGLLTLLVGTLLGLGVRYVGALRTARDQGVFLRELNDNLATGVLVVGNDDRITFANVAAEKMLGYVDGGLAGRLMHVDVHVKDDGAPMRAQDCALHGVDTLASQNSSWYELTFRHSDGHLVPVLSHAAYYPAKAGGRTIVSFDDLSEQLKSASTLRKLSQAVEQNPASIVITDLEGRIEYVNQAFVRNSGYSLDEAIGQNSRMLQSGKTPPERFRAMWETLASGGSWSGELINRRKDGSEYVEFIVIAPVRQPDGQVSNYIAVKNDITQQKAAEQKIQQLAYFDTLTNLPNRRQLLDRLEQALSSSRRTGGVGALLMLDLDHFKQLNDTRGHDVGDLFLTKVAQRLRKVVREEDTVARFGGDEFIVLTENLGTGVQDAAAGAERLGNKLINVMRRPYRLDDHADLYTTTASIGLTLFEGDRTSVESLLKQADLALYKAKDEGRNALRFFDPAMQRAVDSRSKLEAAMRRALALGEFALHYQKQVNLDGYPLGAEALMRWTPPGDHTVSPAEFIPVAEDSGLIIPLGGWALNTACAQLRSWAADPRTARLSISVNVSARQFHEPDFTRKVRDAVQVHGVEPSLLKLELTESVIVSDVDAVIARMRELSSIGVCFSLDDFGTGYSSLAYIKRMPLQQIKIDQSFVRDIEHDANDAAIVRAVLAMCESLGIDVIAEGVETPAQFEFLARNGCRKFQGYLFGKAVPAQQWAA